MALFTPSPALFLGKPKEQPMGVQPPPPPLKAMSVEEALKKPEFQLPVSKKSGRSAATKVTKHEAAVCIDLTDSDDEKESEPKSSSSSAGQAVNAAIKFGSGGLQLGSSGVLKLGTSGGLQLEGSGGMSTIAGARSGISTVASTNLKAKTDSTSSASSLKPLSQFAPPSGSWECNKCLVSNKPTDKVCVVCSAPKPPTKTDTNSSAPTLKALSQFAPPSGSWECGKCLVSNKPTDKMCVACSAPKPGSSLNQPGSSLNQPSGNLSLGTSVGLKTNGNRNLLTTNKKVVSENQPSASINAKGTRSLTNFGPPPGSWSCDVCLVQNKTSDTKCTACGKSKPGAKTANNPPPIFGDPAAESWTCRTCLVKNKADDTKCVACQDPRVAAKHTPPLSSDPKSQKPHQSSATLSSITPLSGFAPPAGSWTCDTCLVQNKAEDTKCVSCTAPKPGAPPPGGSETSASKPGAPPVGGWTCDTCLVQNKVEDTKCVACTTPKPGASPAVSWTCDTCLVLNKAEDSTCVACTAPKPGAKVSDSKPIAQSSGGLTMGASGGLKLGSGVSLSGFIGNSSRQEGLKLFGSVGKETHSTAAVGGGIKITTSLAALAQSRGEKPDTGSKPGSGPTMLGSPQTSSQPTIAQLPEKNPLAGIKFGMKSTTSATTAISQNPLVGIKFGTPSTTTTTVTATSTAPVQFNLGTTSSSNLNSSSPFKLGSVVGGTVGEQTGGLKLGGPSPSMGVQLSGTQTAAAGGAVGVQTGGLKFGGTSLSLGGQLSSVQSAAPKFAISQGEASQSSPASGMLTGAQPTSTAANPLSGLMFGAPAQSSSHEAPAKLQFPSQLQFGGALASTAGSSTSRPSFTFSAATTTTQSAGLGSNSSPFVFHGANSSTNKPLLQFGASAPTSTAVQTSQHPPPPMLNSMLNTSSTGDKPSSSLFVFSGSKDVSKIDSSSPFPSAGSASGSLGGFGAVGMGGATGLAGGVQPLKLNFAGAAQQSNIQPFQFGSGSSGSSSLFGKQEAAGQPQGLSLMGK